MSLKEALRDWVKIEVAQYELGRIFGVLPVIEQDESKEKYFLRLNQIFQNNFGLGKFLYTALQSLYLSGVLERELKEETSFFRFNRDF